MTESKHKTQGAVSAGQRRHVSLLFSDICDYTLLSEQVDPEEADEFRDRVEALAASIVRKHGGQITQVYGDGVLSVFGLPSPGEGDVRRAVNAALELHEAVRNASWTGLPANFEARLHSGVHAGLVFVRQGDALHGRYQIAGDTANTAARLCAVAPRDEVWVSDAALSGSEMFFEAELVPQVTLKGKALPMTLYRVNGRSDVQTRFEATARRGLTAFVDRVHEMGALLSSVRESSSGRGSLMVITGAAGIGKTRLLAEFTARATKLGATVLRGACDSYGELAPLEPFTQVLRQVFGVPASMPPSDATPLVEQVCARLGENVHRQLAVFLQLLALSPGDRTSLGANAVSEALSTLIDTLAANQAIALILDDWQWADDASRTVLGQLHAIVKRRGGCIVVGMRMTELSDPTLQPDRLLGLQPLGDPDGIRVITSLRPQPLALGVTQTLLQRAGGNPLFLEELCRSLSDDSLDGRQALVSADIPQTVQGVIQARVSALPARMASLLRTAAVIGIEFSKALLDHVFEGERNDSAFEALISSDLIYRGTDAGIYRFKHGLTREVVYESVLMSERRRIHAAVASAIEQGVHANPSTHTSEALAYHYRGSGDFERAAHHATLAGDRAMRASALDRARYHYLAALNALERLPMTLEIKRRWLSISAKWALPFVFSPARDQLLTLHTATAYATELSDYAAKAACGHWLGWAHYTLGDYTQSIEHYQNALDLAQQQGDRRLVAQLFSVLGQSQAASGSYVTALGNLEHGLALKKNHALNQAGRSRGFPQGYAYALGCKALLHADRGEFELSEQEFETALGVVTGNDHAIEGSVLGLRCMALLWRGRFQQALEVAVRNREIAQHVNSAFSFAMSSTFEAYATWRLSGSAEHALRMRSMIDWLQTQQLELFASFNYARLAQVLCAIGDFEGSRLYVDRALERARKGDVLGEAAAYTVLARLSMDGKAPSPAIAHDYLARARQAANARTARHEIASVDLLAAELHWIAGERELAQKSAEAAQTEMLALGMEWHSARASDLLARLSSDS